MIAIERLLPHAYTGHESVEAGSRESAREVDYTWTRLVPMQPSPAGPGSRTLHRGNAVISAEGPWRLHLSDSGSIEQRPQSIHVVARWSQRDSAVSHLP